MSIYQRGEIWYTRFQVRGAKINRSTGTADREEAEQFEAQLKRDLWRQAQLGEQPQRLWQEAVSSWIKAKQDKRSLDDDLFKLAWLKSHFNDRALTDINLDLIETTLDRLDHSNATRNRYYAVIRGVLKQAHYLGWIQSVPPITDREEKKKTPRFLTAEEAQLLLEKLDKPRRLHLRDMVRFSLATGLRESNVTGLLWRQIDMPRKLAFVPLENAKGKRTLRVPLNSEAIDVVKSRAGIHSMYVFTYRGKPVRRANKDGFQAALVEAGLKGDGVNWHTLRHTWASWHVMNGTPLAVLKELGGWATLEMVMIYAHLAPDFTDSYIENSVQKLLHPENKGNEKKAVSG
jgi:integrase